MNYLSIKGFGDLTVLGFFERFVDFSGDKILVTEKLLPLARLLFPKTACVAICADTPVLLNIRESMLNPVSCVIDSLRLRKALSSSLGANEKIFFDRRSFRYAMLFKGFRGFFLNRTNNIYGDYSRYFSIDHENCINKVSFGVRRAYIFPYGSSADRRLTEDSIKRLFGFVRPVFSDVKVVVFESDASLLPKSLSSQTIVYCDFNELFELIQSADFIFTVDTFHLHLAHYFGKAFKIIGSHVNTYFTPKYILDGSESKRHLIEIERAIGPLSDSARDSSIPFSGLS